MILPRFLLREAKESFGLSLYTKAQQFRIRYRCEVKNLSSKNIKIAVIFPIPPNTNNQTIKATKFTPSNTKVGQDKTFGNRYVYWNAQIKPKESKIFEEEFLAEISPVKIENNKNFKISDYKNKKLYTRNEKHVNFKNDRIKRLAAKLQLPNLDVLSTARFFNNFVAESLNYGNPIEGLYSSVESITSKQTDCGGFASLLTALLRYYGIPARIVSGYLLSPHTSIMHAWVEFMLPSGVWTPADPTIENLLKKRGTKRSGKFGFIGSDHLILSYGSDIKIEINGKFNTMDILQNPTVISAGGPASFKVENILTAILKK